MSLGLPERHENGSKTNKVDLNSYFPVRIPVELKLAWQVAAIGPMDPSLLREQNPLIFPKLEARGDICAANSRRIIQIDKRPARR